MPVALPADDWKVEEDGGVISDADRYGKKTLRPVLVEFLETPDRTFPSFDSREQTYDDDMSVEPEGVQDHDVKVLRPVIVELREKDEARNLISLALRSRVILPGIPSTQDGGAPGTWSV